jgi:cytochrome oxidase assembly protein ShyY1
MKERINQIPKPFEYNPVEKFPWINLNQKEMNSQFGYIPYVLAGQFDHSAEVLVKTPRLGNINSHKKKKKDKKIKI